MLKLLIATVLLGATSITYGQASPTATRLAEGQIGVSYVNGHPDYEPYRYNGYGIYADLDFRIGLGAEAEYHYIFDPNGNSAYERTYEIGARYSRHYGRFQPYGKIMVGRGVFNFPQSAANLAYNLYAYGGGSDIRLNHRFNARVEYEAQNWSNFKPNGLTPNMLSVGLAYRFK